MLLESPNRRLDLSQFKSEFSLGQKIQRGFWDLIWKTLIRPSPRPLWAWRRAIIRRCGATIGKHVKIHSSTKIFWPSHLEIGDYSVIGPNVDVYNVAPIRIGSHTIVSQYSYLCAATHDHLDPAFPLVPKSIVIQDHAWVAADAFVGPGVTVSDGAVVGARASVFTDVAPDTIVGGNPAKPIGMK